MIRQELRKMFIFLARDLRMIWTYKLAFATNYINMIFGFFSIFIMFWAWHIPELVDMAGTSPALSSTSPSAGIIEYILIGTIGWGYLWSVMGASSGSIRSEMMRGTFEPIFLTPTSPYTLITSYTIVGLVLGSINMVAVIIFSTLIFDLSLSGSPAGFFAMLILGIVMMFGFGLIVAALNISHKSVGSLVAVLQAISFIFSDVYFPPTSLPWGIGAVSYVCPFYYPIHGMRLALTSSRDWGEYHVILLIVSVLAITILICGILALRRGLDRARREGTLAYY